MAAKHSIVAGMWSIKRFKSTVINDIAVEVSLFTIWATAICLISKFRVNLGISPQMLTVLGTILGLVVSFRTSSAYDRYWEGRKLWSAVTLASRNLGHLIWIHVPVDRSGKAAPDRPLPKDAKLRAVIEKKTMINLVQAFSVSVKHYLRGEAGIFYEDLYPLVSFLPRHAPSGDEFRSTEDLLPIWQSSTHAFHKRSLNLRRTRSLSDVRNGHDASTVDLEKPPARPSFNLPADVHLRPARNPPRQSAYDYVPFLLLFKPFVSLIGRVVKYQQQPSGRNWWGRKVKPALAVESNVPLEICLFLSSYLSSLLKQDLLQPAIASAFVTNLSSFQDTVTALERVRSTPIPFAYQTHLRFSVYLYLLFLPFQMVLSLDWITIPATAFASFLYLGFLEIGAEIEDPFDYDENDLDLDAFCHDIARELAEVTAHPAIEPEAYIFSDWNQPFAPSDSRSAQTILANVEHAYHHEQNGLASVRRTLLRGWRRTMEIPPTMH